MKTNIFSAEDIKRAEAHAYDDDFKKVPVTLLGGEFDDLVGFLHEIGATFVPVQSANQMGAVTVPGVSNIQLGWFLVKTVEEGWKLGLVVHYRAETLLKWLAKQWKLNRIDL